MEKIIQRYYHVMSLMAMLCILATSCVDERYDLDNIDKEIVILKDVTLPIGNLSPITISDILSLENEESFMLRSDANGDFAFVYNGDEKINVAYEIPSFDFKIEEDASAPLKLTLTLPSAIAGMDVSLLQQYFPNYYNSNISFEDMTGSKASLTKALHIADGTLLPYLISDIKEIGLSTNFTYEFKLAVKDNSGSNINSYGGAMYIEKGFTIDFPDWLIIKKNDSLSEYSIGVDGNNKNVLRFEKDMKVSADKSVKFDISIDKIEIPSEFIVAGGKDSQGRDCKKFQIDAADEANMIKLDGDIFINPSDFVKVPESVEMDMNLSFTNFDIKSAVVALNLKQDIDDQVFEIPGVPELLTRDGVVIDIYDPVMSFDVNNKTPFDINVDAHIIAYRGNKELMNTYLGENGANAPLTIPHDFNGSISYSRRGEGGMIANPAVAGLFRTLPDKISIEDISVSTTNDYIEIIPGKNLECSVGYSFEAPLAFGSDLALEFETVVNELDLDLQEVGITSARMAFDIVNTIPLALDLGVTALDADGNPSRDITVELDGNLGAGTLDAPSTSTVSLALKSKGKGINLNGLRLDMQASCPTSHQGKVINRNQGIAIRNLKVSLPEGISLDLEELTGDLSNE